jgi:hypothetical protein
VVLDFLLMMQDKAKQRNKYVARKMNEWKKIIGIFESRQKNSYFKEGNKGRKVDKFNATRTLVTLLN